MATNPVSKTADQLKEEITCQWSTLVTANKLMTINLKRHNSRWVQQVPRIWPRLTVGWLRRSAQNLQAIKRQGKISRARMWLQMLECPWQCWDALIDNKWPFSKWCQSLARVVLKRSKVPCDLPTCLWIALRKLRQQGDSKLLRYPHFSSVYSKSIALHRPGWLQTSMKMMKKRSFPSRV